MKFANAFTVQAPIEEAWTTLLDLERVAPCMPGAEVLERTGDNAYKVGIGVKLGPISMTYRGRVDITERDDASHQATMQVKAREARGQGTADASVHISLREVPEGSKADMATDLQLSGRAASMGRGVIGDVAERLIETFADNLAEMLAGDGARPPADAPAAFEPPDAPVPPPAEKPLGAPQGGSSPEPTAAVTPPPPPPKPSGGGANPVQAFEIAASVIAGRLKNPRTLLLATGAVGLAFGVIGYAIGRSR